MPFEATDCISERWFYHIADCCKSIDELEEFCQHATVQNNYSNLNNKINRNEILLLGTYDFLSFMLYICFSERFA